MKTSLRKWVPWGAIIALSLVASTSRAATFYVKPSASGSGNGSDWTNAMGGSFTPARGNVYYLADGDYGRRTWNTANSGTATITIKKATVEDHGSNTGWSDTLGDGQATWRGWDVHTDYWIFDGQRRDANWANGAVTQYGFKVTGGGSSGKAIRMDNGGGTGCDNSVFRYMDCVGGGQNTGAGDDVVYGLASNANVTFQYCAVRDSDRTLFLWRGSSDWQNFTAEYCYLARNNSTPAIHGEMVSCVGADRATFRFNVIEDIEGTGIWAVLNGGGSKTAGNTADGWRIYGNVIRSTSTGGEAAALIYVANDASNRNWMDNLTYANNTHVNTRNSYYIIYMDVAGTGNITTNNIFYSVKAGGFARPGTLSYNWYFNTPNTGDSGPGKIAVTSGGADYFVQVPSNMRLTRAIAGNAMATEFKTDFDGKTRGADGTWDRGAFEFGGGATDTTPPTITNVRASGVTASEATIAWTTNEAGTSVVEFGPTSSYGSTKSDPSPTTDHSVTITGLQTATTYQYRVRSADAAGNVATSGNFSFTTMGAADSVSPTVAMTTPSGGATVKGSITLSADASDNVGVVGVQFLVDGKPVGQEDTVSPFSILWSSLSVANGAHTVAARARDAAGNITTSAARNITVSNSAIDVGLVGYWKFDEKTGTEVADISGNGGIATLQPGVEWTSGIDGAAIQLNGTATVYALVPDSLALRLSGKASISLWVKHTALPADRGLMYYLEKGADDHDNYAVGAYTASGETRLFFEFEDSATRAYRQVRQTAGTGLQSGVWTHVAVVFDEATDRVRFYIGGKEVANVAETGAMNATLTAPLSIGRENMAGYEWPLNGAMDELRIYNRALTVTEVEGLNTTPPPPPPENLRIVPTP